MASTQTIAQHYGRADLGTVILAALNAAGKNIDRLEPDDLAPIDELHSRGRESTSDLAQLLALKGDETVLDVGCGIGGPSRYLAKTYGCRVTGLDLTPEFCQVATMLAERTGLAGKVEYPRRCAGHAIRGQQLRRRLVTERGDEHRRSRPVE